MNREDIIRMAREAGDADRIDPFTKDGDWVILTPDELERFAALVASAERESLRESFRVVTAAEASAAILHEREACAKVCEAIGQHNIINQCAEAIRARGQA